MSEHPHSCPTCCLTLGYVDDLLYMTIEDPGTRPWWFRWKHPWRWLWLNRRADWAADLLNESGK